MGINLFFSWSGITNDNSARLEYYQYIVVGAGPSGIIAATELASRISEKSGRKGKVLLLESGTSSQSSVLDALSFKSNSKAHTNEDERIIWPGKEHLNRFDIPLQWTSLSKDGDIRSGDSFDSSHHWPIERTFLGRAIGGSGIHNAMINIRALSSDFSRWNMKKWVPENIMPYFNKLETYDGTIFDIPHFWATDNLNYTTFAASSRGKTGPIKIVPAGPLIDPIAPVFVESCLSSGLPLASMGFNDPKESKRVGAGYYEFSIRNGIRDSVASAFLSPDENGSVIPDNLVIKSGATVIEILTNPIPNDINKENKRRNQKATGIKYMSTNDGQEWEARLLPTQESYFQERFHKFFPAEIILAAGAILTPQLLANSGIHDGGKIVDLPGVGKNLQDHPMIPVAFQIKGDLLQGPSTYDAAEEFSTYKQTAKKLLNTKSLNLTDLREKVKLLGVYGTAGLSAGAFLCSPFSEAGVPDIQLTVFPRIFEPHVVQQVKSAANSESKFTPLSKGIDLPSMLVTVALIQPEARHKLRLATHKNVNQSDFKFMKKLRFENKFQFRLPIIETGNEEAYLTDKDVKRLAWGINEVRRIKSFPPLSTSSANEVYPGHHIIGTELHTFIRKNYEQNSHWSGSTKMGHESDPDAVVDEHLRVMGFSNLRIVDAGVMPIIPNGNTHSTVCAIALRAVDLILGV